MNLKKANSKTVISKPIMVGLFGGSHIISCNTSGQCFSICRTGNYYRVLRKYCPILSFSLFFTAFCVVYYQGDRVRDWRTKNNRDGKRNRDRTVWVLQKIWWRLPIPYIFPYSLFLYPVLSTLQPYTRFLNTHTCPLFICARFARAFIISHLNLCRGVI